MESPHSSFFRPVLRRQPLVMPIAWLCCSWPAFLHGEIRSYDGLNNNLQHPEWGAAGSNFQRLAPAAYSDGMSALAGTDRPNARYVSNMVATQPVVTMSDRALSDLVWCWGQFLDHDITLSLQSNTEFIPIDVEPGDVLEPMIPVMRTIFDPATGGGRDAPRQQINNNTAFIDASVVYGFSSERAMPLRTMEGGRMIISNEGLLPRNTALLEMDNPNGLPLEDLYMAGDARANENPALISIHTLWLREHNFWADTFGQAHPGWSDEDIYQKARKMVGGEIQSITYNEFLPALLGAWAPGLDEAVYDPGLNPGMFNEVAAGLYRIGHSMISSDLMMMENSGAMIGDTPLQLRDVFFNPQMIRNREDVGHLLKGLASKRMQEIDLMVIPDLRDALFGAPGEGGMDLIAINIQRGRDHGLPVYNDVRAALDLAPAEDFADISSSAGIQEVLATVYEDIDTIDLWIGAMAEDHLDGASVGETLAVGLARQFRHLRDGDRFFFLFDDDLTRAERERIRNTTFAEVLRRNTEVTRFQDNVFHVSGRGMLIDMDGDGASDMAEAKAATDPNDPSSVLRILSVFRSGDETVEIRWSSVTGKTYRIEKQSKSFSDWNPIGEIDAAGATTAFEDTAAAANPDAAVFYRVAVGG